MSESKDTYLNLDTPFEEAKDELPVGVDSKKKNTKSPTSGPEKKAPQPSKPIEAVVPVKPPNACPNCSFGLRETGDVCITCKGTGLK
jgi:hypothetical protein